MANIKNSKDGIKLVGMILVITLFVLVFFASLGFLANLAFSVEKRSVLKSFNKLYNTEYTLEEWTHYQYDIKRKHNPFVY